MDTYKRNKVGGTLNTNAPGIFSIADLTTLLSLPANINILKTIYKKMIDTPKYEINANMFCFINFKN
jgi:hypothetical protein